ncbi:MAG: L,D-transpeptidase [Cyanobacteria bacterium P01_F01_bin.150]
MQYNNSISQSLMAMSFVAAGLLLSVQLSGYVSSRHDSRTNAKVNTKVNTQENTALQLSSVQQLSNSEMGRLPNGHASTARPLASQVLSWSLQIPVSPVQAIADRLAKSARPSVLESLEFRPLNAQSSIKKVQTQAVALLSAPENEVNFSEDYSIQPPLGSGETASKNHQQTEHRLTEPSKNQQEYSTARLVVDLSERQLTFYQQEKEIKTYPIAIGKMGWETPLGEFTVTDKDPSPLWRHPLTGELVPSGKDSPLGSRWIGFWSDGIHQIGFHGTNKSQSIGQAISHGCIRLHDTDIQELYAQVALGTLVIVQP